MMEVEGFERFHSIRRWLGSFVSVDDDDDGVGDDDDDVDFFWCQLLQVACHSTLYG